MSSCGAPVSAWGMLLLLTLPGALADCEEGNPCMALAFAGPGREGMLTSRCAVCALTAVKYFAAFA